MPTTWGLLGDYLGNTLGTTWGRLGHYMGKTLGLFWQYFGNTSSFLALQGQYLGALLEQLRDYLGHFWYTFGHIVTTSWLLAERGQHIAILAINIMIFQYVLENFLRSIDFSIFYVFILPIFRWYPALQTSLLLLWCYLVDYWCCRQNPEKVRSWYHEYWT